MSVGLLWLYLIHLYLSWYQRREKEISDIGKETFRILVGQMKISTKVWIIPSMHDGKDRLEVVMIVTKPNNTYLNQTKFDQIGLGTATNS